MKKIFFGIFFLILSIGFLLTRTNIIPPADIISGAPPYDPGGGNISDNEDFSWLNNWTRPDVPVKVALQVGHWKNDEVPEELHRLKGNAGASGGGMAEYEVNYQIAIKTQEMLENHNITVDILPATIPPRYWADVFVSIHADGSLDPLKSGYKVASPRRDITNKANRLVKAIEEHYEEATGFENDPMITRNMTGYYGFSWWRYEHAVHPMTTSAILETGFLTSPADRETIVSHPEISAQGLADGILAFLTEEQLIPQKK